MVGNTVVSALSYAMSNLKTAQMNGKCRLIQKFMHYKFELGQNATEATKNICCIKDEDTVDYSTVIRWFKLFCSGSKNLDNQARSCRPKSMDFKAVLQVLVANPASSSQRVSGKLSISQSWRVCFFHDLIKSIWICWNVFHFTKILKIF